MNLPTAEFLTTPERTQYRYVFPVARFASPPSMEQAAAAPVKKTPLNARHGASGAKMVPFGGWDMPVEYYGIVREHMAVRTPAGLFDVSHMGEIEIAGKVALAAVQAVSCNDASKLHVGQAQYSGLNGPIWIVKGAPGTADFQRFYTAAAEKGLRGEPRTAKAQPGQARATTEMYREMAATGGVPYETEMNFKMSGEGPDGRDHGADGEYVDDVVQSVEQPRSPTTCLHRRSATSSIRRSNTRV